MRGIIDDKKQLTPSNIFVRACADGDVATVKQMLAEKADPNQRDEGFAETFKDDKGAEHTFHGSDMREPNTFGATGMEMAMRTHNLEIVKLLYAAGANPLSCDRPQSLGGISNALTQGISNGFVAGVRFLIDDCGLPLHEPNNEGDGRLLVRAMGEKGSFEMLRYLVEEKGVDLHAQTSNGLTAAHMANDKNAPIEFLEYCYQNNAVPKTVQNITPLLKLSFHEAVKKDLEAITGSPFDAFEDGMAQVKYFSEKSTYLNQSVFFGDIEKLRVHLKYGANPFQTDSEGMDAFGVLKRLRGLPAESLFQFGARHAKIEQLLLAEITPKTAPAKKRQSGPEA